MAAKPYTLALAGNPNVGKSTVFNALTGLHQHTGNWPGKTVGTASGSFTHNGQSYILCDLPGTYSLSPHSPEEEAARSMLCFQSPDAVIAVCDACAPERGIQLALQILEICGRVVLCLNLSDEAEKKHIHTDIKKLEKELGVPVVSMSARSGKGLDELVETAARVCQTPAVPPRGIRLPSPIREVVQQIEEALQNYLPADLAVSLPWLARIICEEDDVALGALRRAGLPDPLEVPEIVAAQREALASLRQAGLSREEVIRQTAAAFVIEAEGICAGAVEGCTPEKLERDRKLDRILTGKWTGIPFMLLLLGLVLWITIRLSNVPSSLLMTALMNLGEWLRSGLSVLHAPVWLTSLLIDGLWRVAAWVTAVMLPPMAIFFPLFTLLEDAGYLPRVAFNLDPAFRCAGACGKQALTTCMGFGCNALGVQGCRIIDSPREQKLAMLTNVFVPCNGRFPFLITVISIFFAAGSSLAGAGLLTCVIAGGIALSLLVSGILSHTILRGEASAFTLELPAYRRPQFGRVIVHGIIDRVVFVMGRALKMAAPAGVLLWLLAHIPVGNGSLLTACAGLLDPIGCFLGLDGVILLAFILGFPANEIVLPIILMTYLGTGMLTEAENLAALGGILQANGWTVCTALCTLVFTLLHWPCAATCATLYRETHSVKTVLWAILIPTATGCILCAAIHGVWLLCSGLMI